MDKVYTVEEFLQEIPKRLNEVIKGISNSFSFSVRGILEKELKDLGGVYYANFKGAAGSVELEIKKEWREQLKNLEQKEIIVKGYPKIRFNQDKGKIEIYIRVEDFNEVGPSSREEQENILLNFLKTHFPDRKDLPVKGYYTITVITSKNSVVKQDFENQLKDEGIADKVAISFIETNLYSVQELKQSIEEAQGDIVVLIRGGGDESGFQIFDNLELVEAWANKDAYRVSGLGHSSNKTILDLYSHISADNPTDAGKKLAREIRKKIKEFLLRRMLD